MTAIDRLYEQARRSERRQEIAAVLISVGVVLVSIAAAVMWWA